jgi:aminopeptidase
MLTQRHLDRYADVLLWGLSTARHGKIRKNEIVLIRYDLPAVGLAEILFSKLLEKGLQPMARSTLTPGMERRFFSGANAKQLVFQPPGDPELYGQLNGSLFLHAPESITHLSGIDPGRIGKAAVARKPLRDILDRREAQGLFSWSLCMLPTEALAHHAGLTLDAYSAQIVNACFLNRKDPVGQWKKIHRNAADIKTWLNRMDVARYHIESETIDLEVTAGKHRRWIGISGHNIPSFELFLSPDWRGTRGVYYANQPSYRSGNYVKGVRLEFEKGVAVKATAEEGEAFVQKQLAMDRGASRIGEFSLTDRRFSKINRFMANTLFDENYGGAFGNCHVALGASYSDTYDGHPSALTPEQKKKLGFNDSALHWDLVNTEKKQVTATLTSGKKVVIYRDGQFQY